VARGKGEKKLERGITIKAKFDSSLGNKRTGVTNSITFESKTLIINFHAKERKGSKEIDPCSPLFKYPDSFDKRFLITIDEEKVSRGGEGERR